MEESPRLLPLSKTDMSEAQRRVYDAIVAGPRGGVRGPFDALLRSPGLADRMQKLGACVRFETSLAPRLSELAILVTARHWGAQYEWYAHRRLAEQAGLGPEIADAIAAGRRPAALDPDEAAVYDFARELHETKNVGDAAWGAALERFGERGVIDLIGTCGYYTLVSMVLNATRHPLPEGVAPPLRPLSQPRRSGPAPAAAPR
ncbi:MAG TPA: carboxymuconolactone decarboxylase family protein [Burkholderiales bacterium]|nr:carboxymuconolactone decarboxylase family protein [Burkholderiales bacterium]